MTPREPPGAPLSIVYYDHCAQLGGAEIALLRLLGTNKAQGATVLLGEDGPLADELRKLEIPTIIRPLPASSQGVRRGSGVNSLLDSLRLASDLVVYILGLRAWLRERRPDVVHLNSLRGALIGAVAARLAGTPVVWHAHDTIDESYLSRRVVSVVRAMVRVLPHGIVANSAWTLHSLRLGGRQRAIVTAVIPPPLPPGVSPRAELWTPTHGHHELVMVGRLAHWKGQDQVLRALALIADLPWQMRFVGSALFGEDEYAKSLVELTRDLGLAGRVAFVPFLRDPLVQMASAHVLVHYSRSPEPFGMVVTEGLVSGLAVVAADAGGPSEVIRNGENGLLVPPNDPHALAAALRSVLTDRDLSSRLQRLAATDLDRFAPDRVAVAIDRVHQLASRR